MLIVTPVKSCAWLSIIARSELGPDLHSSVINGRSKLGSDLDCYEFKGIGMQLQHCRPTCLSPLVSLYIFSKSYACSLAVSGVNLQTNGDISVAVILIIVCFFHRNIKKFL